MKSIVDAVLDGLQGAEAGGELQGADTAGDQRIADGAVENDIGAAEFVDGLFGIAHHEEFSWLRCDGQPVGLLGVG